MTDIARTETTGALTVASNQYFWTEEQKAALAQIGVDDAGNADLAVFLQQCQRTGLDPFARQIYMIGRYDKRNNATKWTIQVGIDGLRIVAERSGKYAGQTPVEWCGPDGRWVDVWVSDDNPVAARVGVYRSDFAAPLYAVAHFREYAPTNRQGGLTGLWGDKGAHMIAKVAEALGLRKAFPNDLSGLYTSEEMAQADRNSQSTGGTSGNAMTVQRQPATQTVADVSAKDDETGDKPGVDTADETPAVDNDLLEHWKGWKSKAEEATDAATRLDNLQKVQNKATQLDGLQGATDFFVELQSAIDAARIAQENEPLEGEVVEDTTNSGDELSDEDWERMIAEAQEDNDAESLGIYIDTLKDNRKRLAGIARAALNELDNNAGQGTTQAA